MSNEYFQPGSVPAPNSPGSSAVIRNEFANIAAAFDKLPTLADNAGYFIAVDPTGTRLISAGFNVDDIVTLDGEQTLTNKTIAWDDNSFPGFGTAATKNASTVPGTGEVPVMVGPNLFGPIDGSNLINLNTGNFGGVVPVSKGGTGASDVTGAQASLGIDPKANINSPSFTGTPTAPTPGIGDASARVATTTSSPTPWIPSVPPLRATTCRSWMVWQVPAYLAASSFPGKITSILPTPVGRRPVLPRLPELLSPLPEASPPRTYRLPLSNSTPRGAAGVRL